MHITCMAKERFEMVAKTFQGLEEVLAEELRALARKMWSRASAWCRSRVTSKCFTARI